LPEKPPALAGGVITRLAMNRSASGGMALSCSETLYHEGRYSQPAAVALSVNAAALRGR